jgi:hypothetical protein
MFYLIDSTKGYELLSSMFTEYPELVTMTSLEDILREADKRLTKFITPKQSRKWGFGPVRLRTDKLYAIRAKMA